MSESGFTGLKDVQDKDADKIVEWIPGSYDKLKMQTGHKLGITSIPSVVSKS